MAIINIPDGEGAWIEFPTVRGKTGAVGPMGPRGFQGQDGNDGKTFTYYDLTEAQIKSLKQPALDAAIQVDAVVGTVNRVVRETNNSLLDVTLAIRDSKTQTTASKIATTEAKQATIIALSAKGPKGDPFSLNATGILADRYLHDSKKEGFTFLDYIGNKFYVKKSEAKGDWTDGITFVGSRGTVNSEEYSDVYYGDGKIHLLKDEGDPIYALTTPEAVIDVANSMTLRDHINNIPVIEILTEAEFDSLVDKDENKFYFIQED